MLREALVDAASGAGGGDAEDDIDIDMEAVVDALLTRDYVRDLEERGFPNGLEISMSESGNGTWEKVAIKKKPPSSHSSSPPSKRKTPRSKAKKIPLTDVRQNHTSSHSTSRSKRDHTNNTTNNLDPWNTLTSISTRLSSLTASPPTFFLSYFHNPVYPTTAGALRGALRSISQNQSAEDDATLDAILEILRASPSPSLDPSNPRRVEEDAQLALRATSGRGEDTLDLIWLLWELEDDPTGMGVYHELPASSSTLLPAAAPDATGRVLATKHPPAPPPSSSAPTDPSSKPTPNGEATDSEWYSVPTRRKPGQRYPHSAYIPSSPSNTRHDITDVKYGDKEWMRKRNAFLRQAAQAWRGRAGGGRGAEVAAYYAERAREVQDRGKKEELDKARRAVQGKRCVAPLPLILFFGVWSYGLDV